MQLPEQFENRMKMMLKDEYASFCQALDAPFHHGLRVNTRKIRTEDFLKICPFSLKPVPWVSNGFYL